MKRLLVRLSLLSVLVAGGVFAIAQAQHQRKQDQNSIAAESSSKTSPANPRAPEGSPGSSAAARFPAPIPFPSQFSDGSTADAFVMPAPSQAIVRGNDEGVDNASDSPAAEAPSLTSQFNSNRQPEANSGQPAPADSPRARNPFARRPAAPAPESSTTAESEFTASGPALAAPADSSTGGSLREYSAANGSNPARTSPAAAIGGGYEAYQPGAAASAETPAEESSGAPRELPASDDPLGRRSRGLSNAAEPKEGEFSASANPIATSDAKSFDGGFAGAASSASAGVEGAGAPGPQNLEGPQTPSVTLKKMAPPEIQVGKLAAFEILVQNVGRIAAHQVIVKEEIPRGVHLVDTAPPATPQSGSLVWELGTLQPGDSRQIKIQYMPFAEGDIGSVAVAAFQAQASVRTVCTRPQLTVEQAAPEKVLVGQSFVVRIRLSNPGTGVATKVVLEEDVPDGFTHPSGRALEYAVGSLRPGETRDLDLTLQATKPGVWDNALIVRGEGNLAVEKSVKVEIVAPQLDLAMAGPTRRYLERQATYAVSIANPGTATAEDVSIVGRLPKGMKFVAANNEGQYDPQTHAVVWALAELPPGQRGEVQLTALPVETGEQKIVVEGKGNLDITAQAEHAVTVEALEELAFEIADKADPIEVNKETIYEVKVTNKGSKTATNIRVTAVFPPDMKTLAGDGPARAEVSDNRITFEPLARLNPREQAIFRLQAQGLRAGDQRIQVQIISDDSPTPVTKEESTRVYADE